MHYSLTTSNIESMLNDSGMKAVINVITGFYEAKNSKFSKSLNDYCHLRFSNPTRYPLTLPPAQSQPLSGGVRQIQRATFILQGA